MTLTQLEYIVALDTYRHFAIAADKCFVTQPTLSMQIQKLEDELGIMLFDRSHQPLTVTELGEQVLAQARIILREAAQVKQIIQEKQEDMAGECRIGVIPTLAPYLLPLFVAEFIEKYPHLQVRLFELTTEQILTHLKNDLLDIGILVTPLADANIVEYPLFYEAFVAYVSPSHPLYAKRALNSDDISIEDVWLLNEGHCMRSQIFNLCKGASSLKHKGIQYESGSLETLKRFVDVYGGITLLPELAALLLSDQEQDHIRYFEGEEPVREVSLITHKRFSKKKVLEVLKKEIAAHIPEKMQKSLGKKTIPIT